MFTSLYDCVGQGFVIKGEFHIHRKVCQTNMKILKTLLLTIIKVVHMTFPVTILAFDKLQHNTLNELLLLYFK